MKTKIIAKSQGHLEELIKEEMELHGDLCDLNHIDVSNVESMRGLFYFSEFDGNISKWDVSNVEDMCFMFSNSKFNGDISNWNTASLKHLEHTFQESQFNGDISNWNVSKVTFMNGIFRSSKFTGDLSDWTPVNLQELPKDTLGLGKNTPYWAEYEDQDNRNRAIDRYQLNKHLNKTLDTNNNSKKKIKI
jgi:surface protein